MNKPQYANAFTVSFNNNLHEVVIGFAQEYPQAEVKPLNPGDQQGDAALHFSTVREDICGVVIPEEIAKQLIDILGRTLTTQDSQVIKTDV